ncbi:hypothetical protein MMC08_004943 [Hypocenomyce scalaris]|nr:hypothetical protein [Hypocenomyce scalaris]
MEERNAAMTNRSLRTIRTELEFLTDTSIITPQQLTTILSHLPSQTLLHAPLREISPNTAAAAAAASSACPTPPPSSPPTAQFASTSLSEKQDPNRKTDTYPSPPSVSPAPPPAYGAPQPPPSPQGPPVLATASALYVYNPADKGDLALLPNDRVFITEFMNADWAKGRSERSGLVGIFPRSYVSVWDEKGGFGPWQQQQQQQQRPGPVGYGDGYGNVPVQVAQAPVGGGMGGHGKLGGMGMKVGKKLGNAAIFGAGASMGADLVNSIF